MNRSLSYVSVGAIFGAYTKNEVLEEICKLFNTDRSKVQYLAEDSLMVFTTDNTVLTDAQVSAFMSEPDSVFIIYKELQDRPHYGGVFVSTTNSPVYPVAINGLIWPSLQGLRSIMKSMCSLTPDNASKVKEWEFFVSKSPITPKDIMALYIAIKTLRIPYHSGLDNGVLEHIRSIDNLSIGRWN